MTTCHVTVHIVDPTISILLHPSYREPLSLLSHLLKQPLDCCVNYYFHSFRHFFPFFSATFYYFCRRPSILYKSAILIRIDCSFIYLFFAVNFVWVPQEIFNYRPVAFVWTFWRLAKAYTLWYVVRKIFSLTAYPPNTYKFHVNYSDVKFFLHSPSLFIIISFFLPSYSRMDVLYLPCEKIVLHIFLMFNLSVLYPIIKIDLSLILAL